MTDKIMYVILFTFVVVTMTTAQQITICDEEEENAFLPNVRDCNGWFWCGPNGPEPGNCPPEFNFNPITRACDWPEHVDCFQCPSNQTISTHIMNRSCRSFVRCITGVPTQLICEKGLQFNNVTGQCDLQSVVQCSLRFRCPASLPIDGSIIAVRDPHNCSIYYICVGDPDPLRQECNEDLHFDLDTGVCTFPHLTDCMSQPDLPPDSPEEPIFRCTSDGPHPHPTSCTKYFICANDFALQLTCADGLHFNANNGMCDFPSAANCDRENYRKKFWQT